MLVLVYNPILQSGQALRDKLEMPDPRMASARLAEELRGASAGLLNYRLVETREIHAWPPQRPGTQPLNETNFDAGSYDGKAYVNYVDANISEGALNADYGAIFQDQDLCSVVKAKDISEIWLWGAFKNAVNFGFDHFSYRLAGDALPASATEADRALYQQRRRNIPDCGRTLFLLGANYTENMEMTAKAHRSYNMRAAELLELALRTQSEDTVLGRNVWSQFSQIQLAPGGNAQVGTPLFPPNAGLVEGGGNEVPEQEDYNNTVRVLSGADRWFSYPDLSAKPREIQCSSWDCSNEGFQNWYSQHIPRRGGLAPSGSCANWWQYIADPKLELEPCCGDDCHPAAELGESCASDAACKSGHCACAEAVCVAEAVTDCGSPNWSLCTTNEDCEYGICGCNGAAVPHCLPTGYAPGCN